MLQLKTMLE